MARQPKADGGQRGHRASMRGQAPGAAGKKVLEAPDMSKTEIPELPPAENYLTSPYDDAPSEPVEWSPVVKEWWEDTWTSPMSQEFVIPADLHGLYLGCYFLQRSLDPHLKPSDQVAMVKSFEKVQTQYGLTPQARNALKWQVAQGESAQKRTDNLRNSQNSAKVTSSDRKNVVDLYSRNSSTGTD